MLASFDEKYWICRASFGLRCCVIGRVENVSLLSKKGAILESVQSIYGKKPLKMLKTAVNRWLTNGRAFKQILGCFSELKETIDQISA